MKEKNNPIWLPSGLPLVQHSINLMLDFYHQGKISLEKNSRKNVPRTGSLFQNKRTRLLREGYFDDIAVLDIHAPLTVSKENSWYKCGWTPLKGYLLKEK